jgi:hypothetical protein
MNDKRRINNEQLLNAYIDGELSEREKTQVKRLIDHDEQLRERLAELRKMKALVGSLRPVSAPSTILEEVRASLERKMILNEYNCSVDESLGARHLLLRRISAAAAIIVLLGVLGVIVHNILRVPPQKIPDLGDPIGRSIAVNNDGAAEDDGSDISNTAAAVNVRPLVMELRLVSDSQLNASRVVSNAIYNHALLEYTIPKRTTSRSQYIISCTRRQAMSLLTDLAEKWDSLGRGSLQVNFSEPREEVEIPEVTANQVAGILAARDRIERLKLARDYTTLNRMQSVITKNREDSLSASPDNLRPVQPRMTSGQGSRDSTRNIPELKDNQSHPVKLTITLEQDE